MLELLKDEDLDIRMAAVTGVCAILRQLITHLFTLLVLLLVLVPQEPNEFLCGI
jgi:hypothetical protein